MSAERRNLYRILFLQPEAPQELIKASYRALMTTLRAHPDRGGDHDTAARLNAAYAVLGDPQRRAAYDRALRRVQRLPHTAAPATAAGTATATATATASRVAPTPARPPAVPPRSDPQFWHLERCCPLCSAGFALKLPPDARCSQCDSPLTAAPHTADAHAELLGRRQGERFERTVEAQLHLPGQTAPLPARLRDLSLTGLSLHCREALPDGSSFRIIAPGFDAVAAVVRKRPHGTFWTVHARLLTLQVLRSAAGTFVSTKA